MTDTVRVPREPTEAMLDAGDAPFHAALQSQREENRRAGRPLDAYGSGPVTSAVWAAMLAASPQGEGSSADPTPIKPSADTGELRERMNGLLARYFPEILMDQNGNACGVSFVVREQRVALTDAILDLIQSERGSSPIGQNDQPGLAFSAPEREK